METSVTGAASPKPRMSKAFGTVLVIVGVVLMSYAAINYYDKNEVVVDAGNVELEKKRERSDFVIWQPILGGALTVWGLMIITRRRKDNF